MKKKEENKNLREENTKPATRLRQTRRKERRLHGKSSGRRRRSSGDGKGEATARREALAREALATKGLGAALRSLLWSWLAKLAFPSEAGRDKVGAWRVAQTPAGIGVGLVARDATIRILGMRRLAAPRSLARSLCALLAVRPYVA